MTQRTLILLLAVPYCLLAAHSYSQSDAKKGSTISGRIVEVHSGRPVEYANIVLMNRPDTAVVTGTVSKEDGSFILTNIPAGEYILDVRLIGFRDHRMEITVGPDSRELSLGTLRVAEGAIDLKDVVVHGERSAVTYSVDKKILNVGQMQTVTSETAADVLANVPSVTVDIEGNVSLRGSSSFTVLIDGRPTALEAQDALQRTPASSIESIEIITNPSVKYDPEGATGIINIILKKERRRGLGGIASLNAGLDEKYGGDILVDYNAPDVVGQVGLDYNTRTFPGSESEDRTTIHQGGTSFYASSGETRRKRTAFGVKGGMEFGVGSGKMMVGGQYGERGGGSTATLRYSQWSSSSLQPLAFRNDTQDERERRFHSFNASYIIGNDVNELSSEIFYRFRDATDLVLTELFGAAGQESGRRSTEFGPSYEVRGRVDYTSQPNEGTKFEIGYEGEYDDDREGNGLFEFNQAHGGYEYLDAYSHTTRSRKSEHALYAIYSSEVGSFGFQGGIRGEYTFRKIQVVDLNAEFTIDRVDYFPAAHLSHKFSSGQQVMASYARRIERPRGWYLEPFDTWSDANNVRRGNPSLQPEYIDSYELGFQTFVGDASLTSEVYYRVNNNKIERVRSVYAENVTLTTFENIGKDFSLGGEMLLNFDLFRSLNISLMGNVYHYRVRGVLFGQNFARENFTWRGRLNTVLKIAAATQVQVNFGYQSPTVQAQERRKAIFSTDAAIRQDLFSRALSLTLQVRDLFNSSREVTISEGEGFYSYSVSTRKSPTVMLNIRFNLNHRPDERERERPRGEESFED